MFRVETKLDARDGWEFFGAYGTRATATATAKSLVDYSGDFKAARVVHGNVAYEDGAPSEPSWLLWHYGHLLATVTYKNREAVLKALPRPGYPFSKSDRDGIYLLANYTGAKIDTPSGMIRAAADAYRAHGMSRPFPLKPEPRFASGEY